jgi:hypothetical protein
VAVILLALATLWFVQRGEVLPNTSVAGIDVSGLSADEVSDRLADVVEARETDPVTFAFEGEEHVLVPREVGFPHRCRRTVQSRDGAGAHRSPR